MNLFQSIKLNKSALIISTLLPLVILIPLQIGTAKPMLLAERFWPGTGWVEIALLVVYSVWLTQLVLNAKSTAHFRKRYWLFFSLVFFAQFTIGLTFDPRFLMSGELHLPVPALILAGPLYRGSGFFMLILLLSTIVVSGPGWCSHLCYIGAWDFAASASKRKPAKINRNITQGIRYFMLGFLLVFSLILNFSNAPGIVAFSAALTFGLAGVAVMAALSTKFGYMVHCTSYCPISGFVALLSRLYPLRLKIDQSTCDTCLACSSHCRYDALNREDIKSGRAGWNCTLCGDCLTACSKRSLSVKGYFGAGDIWPVYFAIVIGLHAVFIGLARL